MADETILPCPWPSCGGANIVIRGGGRSHWVICHGCGATGPMHKTSHDAIAAWNSIARETKPAAPVSPEWVQFEGALGDVYWYLLASVQAVSINQAPGEWRLTIYFSDAQWKSKTFPTRAAALAFAAGLGLPVEDADG